MRNTAVIGSNPTVPQSIVADEINSNINDLSEEALSPEAHSHRRSRRGKAALTCKAEKRRAQCDTAAVIRLAAIQAEESDQGRQDVSFPI